VLRIRQRFIALCVVAVWLVATQHCGLEAAGILGSHESEASTCCVGASGCATDGCATVEEGAYRPDDGSPAITAPSLGTCLALICWSHTCAPPELRADISLYGGFERPREWVTTWQCVQRAALSPRAPSLVLA
jgi:hypothetical protein